MSASEREKKYVIPPARTQSARKDTMPFSEKPSTSRTAMPVEAQQRAEAIGATFRVLFSPRRRLTEKFISAIPATHAMYLIPAVPEKDSR